jgi:hypothetical protein
MSLAKLSYLSYVVQSNALHVAYNVSIAFLRSTLLKEAGSGKAKSAGSKFAMLARS